MVAARTLDAFYSSIGNERFFVTGCLAIHVRDYVEHIGRKNLGGHVLGRISAEVSAGREQLLE